VECPVETRAEEIEVSYLSEEAAREIFPDEGGVREIIADAFDRVLRSQRHEHETVSAYDLLDMVGDEIRKPFSRVSARSIGEPA
jgi:hypothetical protein